jgi:hypothetical protein
LWFLCRWMKLETKGDETLIYKDSLFGSTNRFSNTVPMSFQSEMIRWKEDVLVVKIAHRHPLSGSLSEEDSFTAKILGTARRTKPDLRDVWFGSPLHEIGPSERKFGPYHTQARVRCSSL